MKPTKQRSKRNWPPVTMDMMKRKPKKKNNQVDPKKKPKQNETEQKARRMWPPATRTQQLEYQENKNIYK